MVHIRTDKTKALHAMYFQLVEMSVHLAIQLDEVKKGSQKMEEALGLRRKLGARRSSESDLAELAKALSMNTIGNSGPSIHTSCMSYLHPPLFTTTDHKYSQERQN